MPTCPDALCPTGSARLPVRLHLVSPLHGGAPSLPMDRPRQQLGPHQDRGPHQGSHRWGRPWRVSVVRAISRRACVSPCMIGRADLDKPRPDRDCFLLPLSCVASYLDPVLQVLLRRSCCVQLARHLLCHRCSPLCPSSMHLCTYTHCTSSILLLS